MVFAQFSYSRPSSTRSSVSSLCFSSFFGRGGGRNVITSYHHCLIWGLLLAILIFLNYNLSIEGNSVAASSSSLKMVKFVSLISSRNVSMEVREFRVSSVLEFSLHCAISSSILEAILYIISLTFRFPWGEPCVSHVGCGLSHALVVSSTLSRKNTTPSSTWPRRRVHWFRILFRLTICLSTSLDVVIPSSGFIPGSLCFRASFMSIALR